jgi:hypothetical protein
LHRIVRELSCTSGAISGFTALLGVAKHLTVMGLFYLLDCGVEYAAKEEFSAGGNMR